MSDPAETQPTRSSSTSVVYRHVTLVDGADFNVHEDRSVFIALDEPPPVRTVIQLWRGDEARAVVVQRIIEIPDADKGEARGFFGVPADDEAIAGAARVGTEHLGAGTHAGEHNSVGEPAPDAGADANIGMAMPAPVVVHDEGDDDSSAAEDTDGAAPEAAGEAEPDAAEGASSDAASETGGSEGKSGQRRGRRKKKKR